MPPLFKRLGWALLFAAQACRADFSIPGLELVHTVPVATALQTPDLRGPAEVWRGAFDNAGERIDIEQFYAAAVPGSALAEVIEHLRRAGERGVKIRFLLEEKGLKLSDAATLDQLKAIPNLTFRTLAYAQVGGGIIHAKFFVVDGTRAFIGSQNFDWRSLEHIHETGLWVTDPTIAGQAQAIFEQDWAAQAALAAGQAVPVPTRTGNETAEGQGSYLVASPGRYNPAGVRDAQQALPRLLAGAQREVRVQLLDYAPLSYGPGHTRPYYPVIDNAMRAAAARGVQIKLMVSNWNLAQPELAWLQSLARVPNVQVRVVTLPLAPQGFIPYARVIHSKTMEIDGQLAWVGTSNWLGGYLDTSRNLEVVMRNEAMALRIAQLHAQLWDGPYAHVLDVTRDYAPPHPGSP